MECPHCGHGLTPTIFSGFIVGVTIGGLVWFLVDIFMLKMGFSSFISAVAGFVSCAISLRLTNPLAELKGCYKD